MNNCSLLSRSIDTFNLNTNGSDATALAKSITYQDHNYGVPLLVTTTDDQYLLESLSSPPPPPPQLSLSSSSTRNNNVLKDKKLIINNNIYNNHHQMDHNRRNTSIKSLVLTQKQQQQQQQPQQRQEEVKLDVTRCICKMSHDDGFMICCDKCQVWQHIICMEINKNRIPDKYYCELCLPRSVNIQRAKLMQKKILKTLNTSKKDTSCKNENLMNNEENNNHINDNETDNESVDDDMVKIKSYREAQLNEYSRQVLDSLKNQLGLEKECLNFDFESSSNHDLYTLVFQQHTYKLKAQQAIKSNTFIIEYNGHVTTNHEYNECLNRASCLSPLASSSTSSPSSQSMTKHTNTTSNTNPFLINYSVDSLKICVNSSLFGNQSRFIRKSCTPNCLVKHILDTNGHIHFLIISQTNIPKGCELTIPYDECIDLSMCVCVCNKLKCTLGKLLQSISSNNVITREKRSYIRRVNKCENDKSPCKHTSLSRLNQKSIAKQQSSNQQHNNDDENNKDKDALSREDRKLISYVRVIENLEKKTHKRGKTGKSNCTSRNVDTLNTSINSNDEECSTHTRERELIWQAKVTKEPVTSKRPRRTSFVIHETKSISSNIHDTCELKSVGSVVDEEIAQIINDKNNNSNEMKNLNVNTDVCKSKSPDYSFVDLSIKPRETLNLIQRNLSALLHASELLDSGQIKIEDTQSGTKIFTTCTQLQTQHQVNPKKRWLQQSFSCLTPEVSNDSRINSPMSDYSDTTQTACTNGPTIAPLKKRRYLFTEQCVQNDLQSGAVNSLLLLSEGDRSCASSYTSMLSPQLLINTPPYYMNFQPIQQPSPLANQAQTNFEQHYHNIYSSYMNLQNTNTVPLSSVSSTTSSLNIDNFLLNHVNDQSNDSLKRKKVSLAEYRQRKYDVKSSYELNIDCKNTHTFNHYCELVSPISPVNTEFPLNEDKIDADDTELKNDENVCGLEGVMQKNNVEVEPGEIVDEKRSDENVEKSEIQTLHEEENHDYASLKTSSIEEGEIEINEKFEVETIEDGEIDEAHINTNEDVLEAKNESCKDQSFSSESSMEASRVSKSSSNENASSISAKKRRKRKRTNTIYSTISSTSSLSSSNSSSSISSYSSSSSSSSSSSNSGDDEDNDGKFLSLRRLKSKVEKKSDRISTSSLSSFAVAIPSANNSNKTKINLLNNSISSSSNNSSISSEMNSVKRRRHHSSEATPINHRNYKPLKTYQTSSTIEHSSRYYDYRATKYNYYQSTSPSTTSTILQPLPPPPPHVSSYYNHNYQRYHKSSYHTFTPTSSASHYYSSKNSSRHSRDYPASDLAHYATSASSSSLYNRSYDQNTSFTSNGNLYETSSFNNKQYNDYSRRFSSSSHKYSSLNSSSSGGRSKKS